MMNKLNKANKVLLNDTQLSNETVLCIAQFLLDYCNPHVKNRTGEAGYSNFYGIKCNVGTVRHIWAIELIDYGYSPEYRCLIKTDDGRKYHVSYDSYGAIALRR